MKEMTVNTGEIQSVADSSNGPAGATYRVYEREKKRESFMALTYRDIYSRMLSSARLRLSSAGDGVSASVPAPGVLSRLAAAFTVSIGVPCSCLRSGTVPTITSTGTSKSRPGPDCVATNCARHTEPLHNLRRPAIEYTAEAALQQG